MTGIVFAVIKSVARADPFTEGEIVVGALVPGGHIREIGGKGRKPIKWGCQYEVVVTPEEAVRISTEVTGRKPGWVEDALEVSQG